MLSLERLRVVHAVATYGSVSAAAEALVVTSSAVSQQLARLERELGQPVVQRNGRGVRLTDAGELLVGHADRILSLVQAAEADLAAHRGAVVALGRQHPQLQVRLSEREPDEAIPLVARGDLDLAVVQDWFNDPLAVPDGLVQAPLLDDVADVALPADHPLASQEVLTLEELAEEPWVSWARGSICHDWLVHMLHSRGVRPRILHTAAEHATQLALVAAGLGAAVMPRLGRDPLPAGVRLVRVEPALVRHVSALWRTDAARRPAIRATVDALRAAADAI